MASKIAHRLLRSGIRLTSSSICAPFRYQPCQGMWTRPLNSGLGVKGVQNPYPSAACLFGMGMTQSSKRLLSSNSDIPKNKELSEELDIISKKIHAQIAAWKNKKDTIDKRNTERIVSIKNLNKEIQGIVVNGDDLDEEAKTELEEICNELVEFRKNCAEMELKGETRNAEYAIADIRTNIKRKNAVLSHSPSYKRKKELEQKVRIVLTRKACMDNLLRKTEQSLNEYLDLANSYETRYLGSENLDLKSLRNLKKAGKDLLIGYKRASAVVRCMNALIKEDAKIQFEETLEI